MPEFRLSQAGNPWAIYKDHLIVLVRKGAKRTGRWTALVDRAPIAKMSYTKGQAIDRAICQIEGWWRCGLPAQPKGASLH